MSKRQPVFDIMKGMAIIAVVMGHFDDIPVILSRFIYSFHMPLFFIVAGYFYHPCASLSEKIYGDFKRLIFPYLLTFGILLVNAFLLHFVVRSDYSHILPTLWGAIPYGLPWGMYISQ